ncbi:MAG: hypothetical protein Q9183_003251, partial [Haloplaca sp. 2 TL-2023]
MHAQQSTIIFYDIASVPPIRPFAPNPWKARYALNFTNTPYSTTWVPLADIAKQRTTLGVPACRKNADGSDYFTLPILRDPASGHDEGNNGTSIGDSFDIAVYLHEKQAHLGNHHPLFPPNTLALHRAFNAHVDAIFTNHGTSLAGYYMPLDPAIAEETRARIAGQIRVAEWEFLEIRDEKRKGKLEKFEAALG